MPIDLARRLLGEGLLTEEEHLAVIARRAIFGEPTAVALHALRILTEEALATLFDRLGFVRTEKLEPAPQAAQLPPGLLNAFWALPIGSGPSGTVVAMADPTDLHCLAELAYHLRSELDPRVASITSLRDAITALDAQLGRERGGTLRTAPGSGSQGPVRRKSNRSAIAVGVPPMPRPRRHTPAYAERAVQTTGQVPSAGRLGSQRARRTPSRQIELPGEALAAWRAADSGPAPSTPRASDRPPPAPAPLRRRTSPGTPLPHEAIYTIAELRATSDRDTIARIATQGMLSIAQRGVFFVVKRGVVQGWEGASTSDAATPGIAREALRNLWIPVTSPSVFRLVGERGGIYQGPLTDTTADSILAAALGGRPPSVLVASVDVRARPVAFLYADHVRDPRAAEARVREILVAATEALERWLLQTRHR